MRPKQWTKNLFIFAAIVFTRNLTNPSLLINSLLAFIIFCGLSGVVYIINDIMDSKNDKNHPQKKIRPIASGRLSQGQALVAALSIASVSLILAFLLPMNFVFCTLAYLLLMIAYSLFLKSLIIIDVIIVSLGFALRLLAGGYAISIVSTVWSLIMTFFLAIFITLIKRRAEREILGDNAINHRKNLRYYRKDYLDYIIIISATSVIISYTLFTLFSGKNTNLFLTIPFVLYGVFRYMYVAIEYKIGEDPSLLFIKDKPLFYNMLSWVIVSVIIIYFT